MKIKIPSLFDEYKKAEKLNKYNDPLQTLNEKIDWESFRPMLERPYKATDPRKGGRPPYDKVMMFKILILQKYYELSDDSIEYQINDRWSFARFLGLSMNDNVPDAKTIWLFRETLMKHGILDDLFVALAETLQRSGLIVKRGKIMDASIMEAPRQRNTREENKQIKAGKTPEGWRENKKRQKDTDADWTKKHNRSYFGFKNHVVVDSKSKIITDFQVTSASVTDREVGEELLEGIAQGQPVYADRGYPSKEMSEKIKAKNLKNKVMRRAARNKELSEEDKSRNRTISKTRCRVEHVFGYMKRHQRKFDIRTIGLPRATAQITLKNISYNLERAVKLFTNKGKNRKLALQY